MNLNLDKKQAYELFQQGKAVEAQTVLARLCELDKTDIELWLTAGIADGMNGDLDSAINRFAWILESDPRHIDALMNSGFAYEQMGDYKSAIDCYRQTLKYYPEIPDVYFRLGIVLDSNCEYKKAIEAYKQALKLNPEFNDVHLNLGLAYSNLENPQKAIEHYKIYQNHNNNDSVNVNLGAAYFKLNNYEQALAYFKKAMEINNNNLDALNNYADVLLKMGEFDKSAEMFSKVLEQNPDNIFALTSYLFLGRENNSDSVANKLEQLIETDLGEKHKVSALFSLADYYDKVNAYDKAFKFYELGNNLIKNVTGFSASSVEKKFNQIISVFTKEFIFNNKLNINSDVTPVFVLGMPRSGTTLVEQILASHTEVFGAGELNSIKKVLKEFFDVSDYSNVYPGEIADLDEKTLAALGNEYINDIKTYATDNVKYIVNKMPDNFMFIGLIKMWFPNAIVIDCERDPRDICWSIYKKKFIGAHEYSHSLTDLAEYYHLYQKLMKHWKSIFSKSELYTVCYERLVRQPESEIKMLINHCGLEWQDQLLSFHNVKRVNKTASSIQVRQKMYTSSIGTWEPYREFLGPILALSGENNS